LARDAVNAGLLRKAGWARILIWECELRKPESVLKRVRTLLKHESSSKKRSAGV
jgi:G:T-mismatch repair DNA endonuclease (very short patch repair protein)